MKLSKLIEKKKRKMEWETKERKKLQDKLVGNEINNEKIFIRAMFNLFSNLDNHRFTREDH